jgi:NAD(P) transhydrogenase subunit alpha
MKVAVPHQARAGETRVAVTPAVAKRLVGMKVEVVVESGAGVAAGSVDQAYRDAGATVVDGPVWGEGDVVVTIAPMSADEAGLVREGAVVVGMLAPLTNLDAMRTLAGRNVTTLAMEFVPRISRAQAMDALSSQANIGGYKAVVLAADACRKMFPMMITAAGTIAPSRVVVLGVGVAGLQAIATAKRLGAVVEANDVRAATKEQVQSLGARFIELPIAQDDKATGGYAKELTDEQKKQQQELVAKHIMAADAVICTAAIFGKAPPLLIPADVVARMNSGSVIVDIAASEVHGRGNCEATRPGEQYTTDNGVTIIGHTNLPALVPIHASQMYANNVLNLLKEMVDKEGRLAHNMDDEVQKGATITHGGAIVNEMVRQAAG